MKDKITSLKVNGNDIAVEGITQWFPPDEALESLWVFEFDSGLQLWVTGSVELWCERSSE